MGSHDIGFAKGFDGHRRSQASLGLRLTPAERLRWLEDTMETMRRWQGLARRDHRVPNESSKQLTITK